jgi:hypothetical protein
MERGEGERRCGVVMMLQKFRVFGGSLIEGIIEFELILNEFEGLENEN